MTLTAGSSGFFVKGWSRIRHELDCEASNAAVAGF